jgi:hypothetical protein
VAALILVLHVNPVLVVHVRAFAAALHPGIANALGAVLDVVAFARTVLADCDGYVKVGWPHAGAVVAPVDTIACPDVEPTGFSNWIEFSVAPNEAEANSATTAPSNFLFTLSLHQGLNRPARRRYTKAHPAAHPRVRATPAPTHSSGFIGSQRPVPMQQRSV